jgi:thiosulfate/3-mercaptopyruvate sulfurtransferase
VSSSTLAAGRPLVVSCDWLRERLGEPDLRIVDVSVIATPPVAQGQPWGARPAREAFELGHIPGAAFVDLVNELSDASARYPYTIPTAARVDAVFERLGVHASTHVVLYDASASAFACRAWLVLREFGLDGASVLDGGFPAWTAAGGPVSQDEPTVAPGTFRSRPRAGVLCDTDDVRRALENGSAQLVNTLARRQWDGTDTSSFARLGQIPGSLEAVAASLVDPESGRFVSPAAARDVFDAARIDLDRPIVVYCGAGVSAAKSALMLTRLGAREVTVYDGSLSKWSAEPDLPLECPA